MSREPAAVPVARSWSTALPCGQRPGPTGELVMSLADSTLTTSIHAHTVAQREEHPHLKVCERQRAPKAMELARGIRCRYSGKNILQCKNNNMRLEFALVFNNLYSKFVIVPDWKRKEVAGDAGRWV